MKKPFRFNCCLLFFLLLSQISFSQLSNFSLTVTKTDETCTANGKLFFNVSGTTSGATIIYSIYLLPNVTTPMASLSANTYTGLVAGNYRVIATQSLGALSNTQQQDIQILDNRVFLTYQLSSQQISCNIGKIIVSVATGNPVSYEIISGPVIIAPQTSNVFNNLPSGTYNIRVNDNCGEGLVQTFTLSFSNPPNLTLGNFVTNCNLNTCTSISGQFLVNADFTTTIRYPLTIQTTTYPPTGGSPLISSQTVTAGNDTTQLINCTIPFYHDQTYTFDIKVTDACGNIYVSNGIQIHKQLAVSSQSTFVNCRKGIEITLCNFLPPYNVNFILAPAGFVPNIFNSSHPGPFTLGTINYESTATNQMPNGIYIIEVTDACGRSSQTQVDLHEIEPGYVIIPNVNPCIPLMTVKIPNTGPAVVSVIMTTSTVPVGHSLPWDVSFNVNAGGVFLMELLPGTYTFQGIDVCGRPFEYLITIPPRFVTITAVGNPVTGCGLSSGSINIITNGMIIASISITQAPSTYNHILPYDVSASIIHPTDTTAQIFNLPSGNYTLLLTDTCGVTYTRVVTVTTQILQDPLIFYEKRGCGEGIDSIAFISINGPLNVVKITAAPVTFPYALPYDASVNIASNGIFYMNNLPEGNYTFYSKDNCGVERTENKILVGKHLVTNNIQLNGNCGSFDLNMNYVDNNNSVHNFWLQKYDVATSQWVHPITGFVYTSGTVPNASNSYFLNNLTTNYNISASGSFRILTDYNYYSNGDSTLLPCVESIKTFDFNGDLKIISAYVIPCSTSGSQVVINAQGIAPLDYKITTKNGLPLVVNNGTSNIFTGLQPGIYNFRVQDLCGNIVNRLFDITTLPEPTITPNNLCNGLIGQLSVEPFSFLSYQWWKGTATTTILSTTNVLTFNPFSSTTSPGIYYVRIYSTTSGSCVDKIISYTIPAVNSPNAGQDGVLTICGNTNSVNLFSVLTGTYDTGGVWEEVTTSGMLSGNTWLPVGVPFGTYTFKYKVNGFCSSFDESQVIIHFNNVPVTPIITVDSNICAGNSIQFNVQTILNATYQWTGPNGFSSTLQNPIITNSSVQNSGNYIVKVTVNGCDSSSSTTINVKPEPEYSIEALCIAGVYTVTVVPNLNSFVSENATYSWSGPNGYSSSINPINITGQPIGNYSVNVTNSDGCSITQSINIANTQCSIPNGISPNGDELNDTFDLSGFTGIRNVKIFNRYGVLVFEQENYVNEWHGQQKHRDALLPAGTYYYLVDFENEEPRTGWVYLSRD